MSNYASTNIQYLGAGGLRDGYTSQGGTGQIVGRDYLDQLRLGGTRQPGSDFPDGYLGTIRSRRDDRLVDAVKHNENTRPYSRGVHKGERIGVYSYFWPDGHDPMRGLRNQARGVKTTPLGMLAETPVLVNDGKSWQPVSENDNSRVEEIDPVRMARLKSLAPSWK